jgi:hypothetical protein
MADYSNTEYCLILTIVNRGYAELVMDAAREAGARGGTVLYARGTGIHATEKFMNIDIQPEKEIVMTIVRRVSARTIMHDLLEASGLRTTARGISFTLPVTDLVGFSEDDSNGDAIEIFEEEHLISDR